MVELDSHLDYHVIPVSEESDAFDPLSDTADGLTGNELDPFQTDPEPGSVVELGGQDVNQNTLTIANGNATDATVQNLSGQSDAPPAVEGDSAEGSISGSGTAAATVISNEHDGDTTVLSAMSSLGGSIATAALTQSPPQTTSPQTAGASAVVLVQTSKSGLSLHSNFVLFGLLAIGLFVVGRSLFNNA
jgi:hypothetical protein